MSPDHQKIIHEIINEISYYLGQKTKASFIDSPGDSMVTEVKLIMSDPLALLADGGGSLIALQHLCRIMFFKKTGSEARFLIDINDYRHNRQQYLAELARDMAQKVSQENRLVILKPMNSYERRIIHLALAEDKRVATESLGEAAERRVIIKPQN